MSGAFTGDGFAGFTGGSGWPGSAIWEGLEQLRAQFSDRQSGTDEPRRDVRAAVLLLVAETPRSGSQIIAEITERSNGEWVPTPGSVYPTLQLLVDEGLIDASEVDGRTTYSPTDAGRRAADLAAEQPAPWKHGGREHGRAGGRARALTAAGFDLAQAASVVGRTGSDEQVDQAVAVLDEARRKLFSILAQD